MKLVIDPNISSPARVWLTGAFEFRTHKLGFEAWESTLHVSLRNDLPVGEGGVTEIPLTGTDHVKMGLSSKMRNYSLGEVFSHEMVHVKQIVTGQLQATEDTLIWKGQVWGAERVLAAQKLVYFSRVIMGMSEANDIVP